MWPPSSIESRINSSQNPNKMNLDQLRESMSTLDEVLASKSGNAISLNTTTCNTAQKRIMRRYRNGVKSSILIAVVFLLQWNAGLEEEVFPTHLKLFLCIFLAIGAMWYLFLYFKTKRIDVFTSTPMQTLRQVASLRYCALTGEVTLAIAMTVFFTLFLSNLWSLKLFSFWVIVTFLAIEVVLAIAFFIPHIIRDFNNLASMV